MVAERWRNHVYSPDLLQADGTTALVPQYESSKHLVFQSPEAIS